MAAGKSKNDAESNRKLQMISKLNQPGLEMSDHNSLQSRKVDFEESKTPKFTHSANTPLHKRTHYSEIKEIGVDLMGKLYQAREKSLKLDKRKDYSQFNVENLDTVMEESQQFSEIGSPTQHLD